MGSQINKNAKLVKSVKLGALLAVASLGMMQSAHAGGQGVIGAVLGAGAGTMIGGEVGGREGAIVGAAIGAAVGATIAADHYRGGQRVIVQPAPVYQPAPAYRQPPVVYQPAPVYQQPPVVYQPPRGYYPPVVVAPGPVYRPPQTVVYAPPPPAVIVQPGWNRGYERHDHRGWGYGGDRGYGHPHRY